MRECEIDETQVRFEQAIAVAMKSYTLAAVIAARIQVCSLEEGISEVNLCPAAHIGRTNLPGTTGFVAIWVWTSDRSGSVASIDATVMGKYIGTTTIVPPMDLVKGETYSFSHAVNVPNYVAALAQQTVINTTWRILLQQGMKPAFFCHACQSLFAVNDPKQEAAVNRAKADDWPLDLHSYLCVECRSDHDKRMKGNDD